MLVRNVQAPADLDWLEDAILKNASYEEPGVWALDVDFDKRRVAKMHLLALRLPRRYDLLSGPDIFAHLNPNKLDA